MTTDIKMSYFELNKFKQLFNDERKNLVFLARTTENAERYEDMCKVMKALVEWTDSKQEKVDLTPEERNLLSVAYKNAIGNRRASLRIFNVDDHKNDEFIQIYKKQVEVELRETCKEILDLLDILTKNVKEDNESRVFYLKMSGDYFRYLAEYSTDQQYGAEAAKKYKEAMTIAETKLQPTNPIRLGLALNYSVCHFEILKDKPHAIELAKSAYETAEPFNDKETTLIMQLLRDNLTLWTADDTENIEEVPGADWNNQILECFFFFLWFLQRKAFHVNTIRKF